MKKILTLLFLFLWAANAEAAYIPLGANDILGSLAGVPAAGQALAIPSCSTSASALLWTSGTGFSCNASIAASTTATINGLITAGTNVTITGSGTSGSPYSIAASGSGTVTSVATNNGLTGGTITGSGTVGLATITNNGVLCNNSGSTAVPTTANCAITGTGSVMEAASPSTTGTLTAAIISASSYITSTYQNATTIGTGYELNGNNGLSEPLDSTTGASIAIGTSALVNQTAAGSAAYGNTAIGYQAMMGSASVTTAAINNTALGYHALYANLTGYGSVAIGYGALDTQNNTPAFAFGNIGIGYEAGDGITTGVQNICMGPWTCSAANMSYSVYIDPEGPIAGGGGTTNAAIGAHTKQMAGGGQVALGSDAGYNNYGASTNTTLIGFNTARNLGSGNAVTNDIMMGVGGSGSTVTLDGVLSTTSNAIGIGIGFPGAYDTSLGLGALYSNTTDGNKNTAIGYGALYGSTTAVDNVAVGYDALYGSATIANNTGANNTAVGYQAGQAGTAISTGSGNTFVGYQAQSASASATNCTAIGNGASCSGSNVIQLGNTSVTTINTSGAFTGPGTGLTGTAASLTAGTATVANGLKSATTTVAVSAATAPTSGQVLTATSSTLANWQTPSSSVAVQSATDAFNYTNMGGI